MAQRLENLAQIPPACHPGYQPEAHAAGLFELGLADRPLCQDQPFWEEVYRLLTDMLARPMQAIIAEAAQ